MKKNLQKGIKNIARRVHSFLTWDQWCYRSWSQEGEDLILRKVFERREAGFYIDVGAHHPRRYSNTQFFYRIGWRGINIDATPGSMKLFKKLRPRDINLEVAVGQSHERKKYHLFSEPALNSFSEDVANHRHQSPFGVKVQNVIEIDVMPLSEVLSRYLSNNQKIDFLTIDVEGMDLDVLESNDWAKYRPDYVLVEVLRSSLHEVETCEIGKYMKSVDYVIFAKCANTVFFREASIR